MSKSLTVEKKYDADWIDLILTAKKMNITIDEIRAFLKMSSKHTPS
ncbi:DNA-binding transcriptional MerR regulator [Pullulanibacillus pueri]|uniref:Sin domain-containing protein n=1 Tax=Pullulanibacillus pueri TaxID=1437324 RepID=A0A8J3ELA2_9BACL|nr:anti-repressor SinI family protein [Pullulanibacillus pueri]MBM7681289.1 DNA-binding transcriptional MerR regulator [Pullulanibacillus pueri]GGH77727.1 hypothetical protein GCM10007096_10050 [Pullulanibacillus pueri]